MQLNANFRRCVAVSALLLLLSLKAFAQNGREPGLSAGFRFAENSGEDLFASVCQGCHMSDGRGASGAGAYPSLAADRNLEASGYPVEVVVNGRRAMPPFGAMMSDDQVAAVVNYLRTHFDNAYQDSVTAEDVKLVRR
jgi:mono/diheme cytochrome c family protein